MLRKKQGVLNQKSSEKKQSKLHQLVPVSTVAEASASKETVFKRRRMTAILLFAFICFSIVGYHLFQDFRTLGRLKARQADIVKEEKDLSKYKVELKDEVNMMHDDHYIEKLARSRYYLSKDGEKVYILPEPDDNKAKKATEK